MTKPRKIRCYHCHGAAFIVKERASAQGVETYAAPCKPCNKTGWLVPPATDHKALAAGDREAA